MQTYGLQFDATGTLPFTPALRLDYWNGKYGISPAPFGRGRVYIDVLATAPQSCFWLDVERFDATPADVPGWLDKRRQATGQEGGIYCSRNSLAAVEQAAGTRPHMLGVATLDGSLNIDPPPGIGTLAFIQAYPAAMLGINADISVVVDPDYWTSRALGA